MVICEGKKSSLSESREEFSKSEFNAYNFDLSEDKEAYNTQGEYEPYANRSIKHPTSYQETLFHMIKASLGTGILSLPSAFKNAGYITGTIGTVVIGLFCIYCIHMLVHAQYELCRRKKIPSLSYPQIAEAALSEGPQKLRWLAPLGRRITLVFLMICELGADCVYVIFIASNFKAVFDHFCSNQHDIRFFVLLIFIPMLLLCWVRNLKYLAPFSAFASFITAASFGVILYYVFSEVPTLEGKEPWGEIREVPLFLGSILFSISSIGIVMPLENEMKNPRYFTSSFGVVNVAMLSNTIIYALFGLFGYLKYGSDILGSITLNLPPNDILALSVRVMQSIAILCTFAIPHYIVFDTLWNKFIKLKLEKNSWTLVWEYVFRSAIVVVIFFSALCVPYLDLMISFIGAFCLPYLCIGLPTLADLLAFWDQKKGFSKVLFALKHVIIVFLAVMGFVTGVSASVSAIYTEIYKEQHHR